MDAIVADAVEKAYGDVRALGGVSLSIAEGEVFGLIGPNGAGKTTLVRCLTGTTAPDAGEISLLGSPPAAADSERIGLLPQDFDPPERLTARELLAYYAGLYDDARGVDAVLADVGLEGAADTRYGDLSGGQRRRTLVGTALVNDPDVLFLDEPTTGIDPAGRRAVWSLVEDLVGGGATVLLTTHDMAEIERLADRVGVMREGSLLEVDAPAALVREHGGESRLVVETDAVDPDLPFAAERTGRGLVIQGIDPEGIADVVAALEERGIPYGSVAWRRPDLETVYLELTGEAPRGVVR